MKKHANRCLRRKKLKEELVDGKFYKKFSGVNAYDICDWKSIYYHKGDVEREIKEWGPDYAHPRHHYYMK
jgi:hypothetical protein